MAKASIRKLKSDRFWRWLCVEVYGKPPPKNPIKRRPPKKVRSRELQRMQQRAWPKVLRILEEWRQGKACPPHEGEGKDHD